MRLDARCLFCLFLLLDTCTGSINNGVPIEQPQNEERTDQDGSNDNSDSSLNEQSSDLNFDDQNSDPSPQDLKPDSGVADQNSDVIIDDRNSDPSPQDLGSDSGTEEQSSDSSKTDQISQGRELKYYGVDRGNPINDNNYATLAQHAVKTIVVDTDVNGSNSSWQNIVTLAEKYNFDVVIWPSDWIDHDTNWPDCGWEPPYLKNPGPSGDRIVKVKALLDAIGGHARVIGIVNAHEPFWSCIMTLEEMADIKSQLKNYVMNQFGKDIQVWNYVDNVAENDIAGDDIERIMDVAVTWQHCFGGAEGSCPQAQQKILDDRDAINGAGLDGKVDLVFLFQTFAMGGGYRMPTATEMNDWSCSFLNTKALDGFLYYTWGACWYDSDLWCPDPEHPNQDLWPLMNTIYDSCAVHAP